MKKTERRNVRAGLLALLMSFAVLAALPGCVAKSQLSGYGQGPASTVQPVPQTAAPIPAAETMAPDTAAPETEPVTAAPETTSAPEPEPISFTMQHEEYEIHAQDGTLCYTAEINYPLFSGDDPLVETLNNSLAEKVDLYRPKDEIDPEEILALADESMFSGRSGLPYYDKLDVQAICPSHYVSLVTFSVFWSGGMHPYSETAGFVYDVETGRQVENWSAFFSSETELQRLVEKYGEPGLDLSFCESFYLSEDGVVLVIWVGDAFP